MWTSNSWAGRYQLQESPRAGHSLERDSGESQGGSQGGKDWRLQASARVQQGTWESRPSPGKGTETDQHPQAATRDGRGCRPAVQPADEGQGSSGDHRAENALEFLTLRALLPRPTPPPLLSANFQLSLPLLSTGAAGEKPGGRQGPAPHREHSARAHSARRVLWAACQPCRPSQQARDWRITAATPVSPRGKLGRRVAQPAVEERRDRHSGGQLP